MIDDGDRCDIWSPTRRKARKPHKCGECSRWIQAGESYLRVSMLFEGHWEDAVLCAHCDAAAQWLVDVCSGYMTGAVGEDLEDHWNEHGYPIRSLSLGRLVAGMRNQWREQRRKSLIPVERVAAWSKQAANLASTHQ